MQKNTSNNNQNMMCSVTLFTSRYIWRLPKPYLHTTLSDSPDETEKLSVGIQDAASSVSNAWVTGWFIS